MSRLDTCRNVSGRIEMVFHHRAFRILRFECVIGPFREIGSPRKQFFGISIGKKMSHFWKIVIIKRWTEKMTDEFQKDVLQHCHIYKVNGILKLVLDWRHDSLDGYTCIKFKKTPSEWRFSSRWLKYLDGSSSGGVLQNYTYVRSLTSAGIYWKIHFLEKY